MSKQVENVKETSTVYAAGNTAEILAQEAAVSGIANSQAGAVSGIVSRMDVVGGSGAKGTDLPNIQLTTPEAKPLEGKVGSPPYFPGKPEKMEKPGDLKEIKGFKGIKDKGSDAGDRGDKEGKLESIDKQIEQLTQQLLKLLQIKQKLEEFQQKAGKTLENQAEGSSDPRIKPAGIGRPMNGVDNTGVNSTDGKFQENRSAKELKPLNQGTVNEMQPLSGTNAEAAFNEMLKELRNGEAR